MGRTRPLACRVLINALSAAVLLVAGCQGFFEQPDSSRPVNLRIENDTSSLLEVRLTVANLEDSSDSADSTRAPAAVEATGGRDLPAAPDAPDSANEPIDAAPAVSTNGAGEAPAFVTIGLRPEAASRGTGFQPVFSRARCPCHTQAKETVSEDVVHVSPSQFTDGVVACGELLTVTATLVGDSPTTVFLSGAGTGTLGFDEGSVGASGERMLLSAVHFQCGDTIVIRVSNTASTVGDIAVASGEVEVFGAAQTPPAPTFDDASSTVSPTDGLEIRINNQTASFVQLHVVAEADDSSAAAATPTSSADGLDVRVPPGRLSTGVLDCAARVVLVGSIVVPAVGTGQADRFNQVVLDGEGTGALGFDENSAGVEGQERMLLSGTHYQCGQVIHVEFTSDGKPGTAAQTLGQATVSVLE